MYKTLTAVIGAYEPAFESFMDILFDLWINLAGPWVKRNHSISFLVQTKNITGRNKIPKPVMPKIYLGNPDADDNTDYS
jgi:hypothetical protein